MKKYLDNLRQYQFLLSELVKKGIKLKYRRSYLGILWSMLGQNIPCIHSFRTSSVQLLFLCNQSCAEIHPIQCSNDQESVCTEISVSTFNCNL